MLKGNIHYEMGEKTGAIACGDIGVIYLLARKIGLIESIDSNGHVLKRHLPYHESDHIMIFALNTICGGQRIEDLELRRQDENYLHALGSCQRRVAKHLLGF
jgi:hypothetical protein